MHLSLPIILGVGLLSSLGLASSLPPDTPKWVEDIKSHIDEHQDELTDSQIEALNDALVLSFIRDEKIAPSVKARMTDAFGEKEATHLLQERQWPVCNCILDHGMCQDGQQCAVGGCSSGNTVCLPNSDDNGPCIGMCV